MPATAPSPLLQMADICEIFRCTKPTVQNWIKAGIFPPAVAIGKKRYWTRETIDKVLAGRRTK
jgi:predicted DNA-binding transcriptional regulator AlpA